MKHLASPGFLALIGSALALLIVGLDIVLSGDPFSLADTLLDLFEQSILVGGMVVIALVASEMRTIRADQDGLRSDIDRAVAASDEWRERSRSQIEGFSAAIAREFEVWGLTPAEAEIAGLMLKGMSLKEVAAARATSEATIRQQARGIYRKSGLSGRAELAAYFLDSLSPVPPIRSAAE